MSHFAVAVFSDGNKTLEELMAPYQENNMNDCPKEYLKFVNGKEEEMDTYENGTVTRVKLPDGTLYYPYDDIFAKEITEEEYKKYNDNDNYKVKREWVNGELRCYLIDYKLLDGEVVEIPYKESYPTIEDYLEDFCGYEIDEETGEYGYWENPNAKWDWYDVGGRWSNMLKYKDGNRGDYGYIKDIDFTPRKDKYKEALRFWEVAIDKEPLKEGEDKNDFIAFYKDSYYKKMYLNKELYAKICSQFSTRAVITPDGKWHEVGEMGWFGCSSESGDENIKWEMHYKERFIDTADPNWILVIVDCHI